ncbi:beta-galactosidase [Micromonospora endolithica]|uniref:Beta-galactosidase n=1 Tax=Micromonospora endolithica TaxID=230091 RepID=A0A3A9YZK3_9ACTN|nr:beta-galactosidase [Micromonospora endolithica]RKN41463.1 beta-galactosidase [Micromonospora endolithica]TWJ21899.1 beta-galactosidase [Micromonospora endolithica]
MWNAPWLAYGGDYNPEQWPAEVWAQDVALMRRARVNLVTVGVFAWSRLQPAPGRFTFDWLDRVLDLLHDGGIRVALATPTASPPPWFSLAHPDALPVTADGVRLHHGSRDTYCAAAPAYRAAARRIAGALADRYAHHPAVALWHVHNEYGTTCHCAHAAAAFRRWLAARHGTLDALNDAWTTSFWGQHYTDWAQIDTPRATQYLANPTHLLDFRRFWSDTLLAAYTEQRDLLRAANPTVPVTTNYVLGEWVPVDHARWAREVDVVAVDHYPSAADGGAEEQTALAADLARGWARHGGGRPGTPWLLMETAPHQLHVDGRMHTKEPGRLLRHSLAHVARGARGVLFFQWRAPAGGAERFHSALVPHAGPDSRVFREAVALGGLLDRLAEVDGPVDASVALVRDAASEWALRHPGLPATGLDHAADLAAAHRALWRDGYACDVLAPGDPTDGYRLLVLPAVYLADDPTADWVRRHVDGGGHLLVTYLSGVADEHARIRLGGYPGAFRDLLGVRVEEFHPLAGDDRPALTGGGTATLWSETVRLAGAETVSAYADGVLAGLPAVTRRDVGAATCWYVSTRPDDDTYARLLTGAARRAGVAPTCPAAPPGVEAVRRVGATGSWLFLLNHTDRPQRVPAAGWEVRTGEPVRDAVDLPAGGVAVLREAGQLSPPARRTTRRLPRDGRIPQCDETVE